jgi:hypothetical protein
MAKAADTGVVVALTSFVGPGDLPVGKGDLFASDDPLVKKYPDLFGPVSVRLSGLSSEPVIERATAAPGEKRGGS